MNDNIKIWGYSENKKTKFQLDHKQITTHLVSSISGQSVFDFMYMEDDEILAIFRDIQTSFFVDVFDEARVLASYHSRLNTCLAIYIAEFTEYLLDGTEEGLRRFTAFMGNSFVAPSEDSSDYDEEFLKRVVASIVYKKAEIKSLVNNVIDDESVSIKESFIRQGKTNKLADFNFNCFLSSEMNTLKFPLKTADDVIRFDLMQMLSKEVEFKLCRYCMRYFVPSGRSDSEYCDRIFMGEERPCRDVGALKVFELAHKEDEIHKAYIKAYRRMDSRQRAKIITKEEFKEFGKMARAERKKCYDGEITLEQFQIWLDKFR